MFNFCVKTVIHSIQQPLQTYKYVSIIIFRKRPLSPTIEKKDTEIKKCSPETVNNDSVPSHTIEITAKTETEIIVPAIEQVTTRRQRKRLNY